jgi:hypothetical protein
VGLACCGGRGGWFRYRRKKQDGVEKVEEGGAFGKKEAMRVEQTLPGKTVKTVGEVILGY